MGLKQLMRLPRIGFVNAASRARAHQQRLISSGQADVSKTMSVPGLAFTGVVAGGLGSLTGMGGGFVAIPMMTHFGVSQHTAHGTSLVGVLATGGAGAAAYGIAGQIDPLAAVLIASTGALTARLGAITASRLDAKVLKRLLGAFMLSVAPIIPFKQQVLNHILNKQQSFEQNAITKYSSFSALYDRVATLEVANVAPLLSIGVISGFLAGIFGVGGRYLSGAIVVPLLALATDMDHKLCLGTSLAAMVPTAIAGVAAHASLGNVRPMTAFPLLIGTCCGAYVGGRLGSTILPEEQMKIGFGILMAILGSRTLLTSFR